MDDAVLGLVWVTSVCILGHIASVLYFQKILRDEALTIDEKITEIDMGIASIAQWMLDKFENKPDSGIIDWGAIINQLFTQNNSPNNLNMIPNEVEEYGAPIEPKEIQPTPNE